MTTLKIEGSPSKELEKLLELVSDMKDIVVEVDGCDDLEKNQPGDISTEEVEH